ncbi:MAG: BamA/TamA family outer membrane protein, partial [Bacteroidota bacterium]|nr:BamA/TamA family outer membrane protein [Bacteroidota bacterium]
HALRTSSYYFSYDGDFTKPFGSTHNDMLIRADLRAPVNVTNFFGIGNNTNLNRNVPGGVDYYRIRYSIANFSVYLRRQLQSWMRINYGPTFQYFHVRQKENATKYVGNTVLSGVDASTLYDRKLFAGAEFLVDINSRNNANLPTRGIMINAGARSLFGLNNKSNNLAQLHADLSIISSGAIIPKNVVTALRIGWAHNIGAFEIPQAQYLSGTANLRGFRRDRFAGRSMFFYNAELRWKVKDFTTFLFPGSIGVIAFQDFGRVWQDGEVSGRWHNGYGGGIYIAPIQRWVVTISVAHSIEENLLPYVSFGFRF